MHFSLCAYVYLHIWKTEKNKHVLYTVYADIRACKKTHMHMTTYRSISPWRGKWSKCGTLFVFLELYRDQTVWFFPVTMLLPWTWPASWRLPLQCSCQLEMKYKKPWTATMLNCSDAIVHEICRCPCWSIHCGEICYSHKTTCWNSLKFAKGKVI